MLLKNSNIITRMMVVSVFLSICLIISIVLALGIGSSGNGLVDVWNWLIGNEVNQMTNSIIWRIRLPRVLMAAMAGAVLSLGGLVFQALLRNPLAEPYILGVSGGAAIGAIIGILAGLARFPGVGLTAFIGSMATLVVVLLMSTKDSSMKKDTVILSGVMVNAFCSAVIMFLISLTTDSKIHNIMFWLMGDLSSADLPQAGLLFMMVLPCFILIFFLSHKMNLLLLGQEMAKSMGVNTKNITAILLIATSFMVSAAVCQCGLLGFVGLVIPHIFRLCFGPDHRVLVPACILGGGAYMVCCDLLARWIPKQGEMPAGVITAMIGAPLFIYLLKREKI